MKRNQGDSPSKKSERTGGKHCLVVGIGASAGGQDALEQLFTAMPADCGLAFVVIMHLPPEGPTFLAEMLGRCTSMKVVTVEDRMPLGRDKVYVIPAGREMSLSEGRFRLETPADRSGRFHPVDRFFHSLASEAGERSIAVVLSGTGTDGALGAKAVRESGGAVIVQDPGTAIHPAMPRSVIETGGADLILPAEELAENMVKIARGTCPLPSRACRATTLDEDLSAIFGLVKERTGHDFSSYKRNTVIRRIERRMAVNETAGLKKYVDLLEKNDQEAHALGQEILIGVTSFFRDPEAFQVLRREIIPRLFTNRAPDDPVRIWHACCATGEEVYSTAILIREYLDEQRIDARVQLFATDIDEVAISQARAGLYSDEIEASVGKERLKSFFTRIDGRWQIAKQLREMVVFAHHSLIKDPPFSRLDLLVCRNFLIYLNPDMQRRLISLFHLALKPQGFLFLGASETVGRGSDLFASIDKKWKVFRRLEGARREDMIFPFATPARRFPKSGPPPRQLRPEDPNPGRIAEKLLLERYSPPCVVVNGNYEVVHVSTRANRFLEVPVGEPTRDILKMAREELRPALRAAIYKTFAEQKQVVYRGVKMSLDGEPASVNVLTEPLKTPPGSEKLAMLILEPALPSVEPPSSSGGEKSIAGDEGSRELLIRQLEEQLRGTHEQLQAVSEQLETSQEGFLSANEELMSINEEFQSANEELQSTNEELETSKEELQALNEELATVNSELQGKVEELDRANSDMENLLKSSEIATLFLDRELTIRRFTPAMAAIFNLIPADIGRPFRQIAGIIDGSSLREDARTVLASLVPMEREVSAEGERHYLMRILPYRTMEGRIDGVAVTCVDITGHKRSTAALRESETRYRELVQNANSAILRWLADGTITFFNEYAQKLFGWEAEEVIGRNVGILVPERESTGADLTGLVRDIVEHPERYVDNINENVCRDGRRLWMSWTNRAIHDAQGQVTEILAIGSDITARKEAEKALIESEQRVRRKLESVLSPDGDLGVLELADIIDSPALQKLMEDFYAVARIPMSIIDVQGRVLVGVGWQEICTRFHRMHQESCRHCLESDTHLTAGLAQGEFRLYKCMNNMWDMATPIIVAGQQLGNIFTGQFFFSEETVDRDLFRAQARKYGFDEKEYLAALDRVPRLSRETIDRGMAFFLKLAGTLSQLGYSNVKLARLLAERDRLTESLRQSEERLNRAQEIAHLGSWELDLVDNHLTWSDEVYRIFGLQPQEFGATYEAFLEAVHPEDRAAVNKTYSNSLAEGWDTYEIEHRVVQKSTGEIRYVHEKCEHFRDETGRVLRSVGMVHDITERRRVEEDLRESEQRYRSLFHNNHAPMMLIDPLSGGIINANTAACTYYGYALDEITSLKITDINTMPPDQIRSEMALATATQRQHFFFKHRLADGRIRDVEVFSGPLFVEGRELLYSIVHDITERKQAEEGLRKAHDELEVRVRERTAELREKDRLLLQQSRQAAMGEMINNIAHQWRQPLNSLGLIMQSLPILFETAEDPQDFLAGMEEKAMEIIVHMSQTIDDFRNYFKPDREKVLFHVNQPVSRTINLLEESFKNIGIAMEIKAADDPLIHGYPNEFAQVLLNILINARDAISERRISDPKVSISLESENGKAIVTIADNAGGIPESILDKIFEPYFSTKGPDAGTGIGLFMSKTIIEKNMGGRLLVRNTSDGAEFRIEV